MSVMVEVQVAYKPDYHLSLNIVQLSTEYSLGSLVKLQQEIINELAKEGILDNQKKLQEPFDYARIAVISPHSAAGLEDFQKLIEPVVSAELLELEHFHATFDANDVEPEMLKALRDAYKAHCVKPFDALVIVRGGGSSAGLKRLTKLGLARAICLTKCPVYTGIGHERDRCVLDDVAHRSFPTPSAVATTIVHTMVSNAQAFDRFYAEAQHHAKRRIQLLKSEQSDCFSSLSARAVERVQKHEKANWDVNIQIDRGMSAFHAACKDQNAGAWDTIDNQTSDLIWRASDNLSKTWKPIIPSCNRLMSGLVDQITSAVRMLDRRYSTILDKVVAQLGAIKLSTPALASLSPREAGLNTMHGQIRELVGHATTMYRQSGDNLYRDAASHAGKCTDQLMDTLTKKTKDIELSGVGQLKNRQQEIELLMNKLTQQVLHLKESGKQKSDHRQQLLIVVLVFLALLAVVIFFAL